MYAIRSYYADWLFFGKGEIFIKDTELAEEPIEKYKLDSEISLEEKIQILEDRIAELKDTIKIQKELIEHRITSYNVCYTKLLRTFYRRNEYREPSFRKL